MEKSDEKFPEAIAWGLAMLGLIVLLVFRGCIWVGV